LERTLSVPVPDGWKVQSSTSPEELKIYRGSKFIGEDCGVGDDYTHVSLRLRFGDLSDTQPFPPRPSTFDRSSGTGLQQLLTNDCESSSQSITFTDHDRRIGATILVGSRADSSRVNEVYEMLDRLRGSG